MIDSGGRQSASATWQTRAALAAGGVGTVIVGRWVAGGTFGYTLFALVWGPIAALWISAERSPGAPTADGGGGGRHEGKTVTVAMAMTGCVSLPWAFDLPGRSAAAATGFLGLFILAVVSAMRVSQARNVGFSVNRAIIGIGWLVWLVAPMTMADLLQHVVGEVNLDRLLAIHPVLLMNAVIVTAGDWTHQNVAYAHLTRLGQDIPFDWPTATWPAVLVYGGVVALAAGRRLFHVEHLQ